MGRWRLSVTQGRARLAWAHVCRPCNLHVVSERRLEPQQVLRESCSRDVHLQGDDVMFNDDILGHTPRAYRELQPSLA